MKLSFWQLFAAVGLMSSLSVAACTTSDSVDDDSFGTGGTVQTGGSSATGGSDATGGTATGGGGAATGGSAGATTGGTGGAVTGGSGGEGGTVEPVICDDGPEANLGSTPGVCGDEIATDSDCGACLVEKCCEQANLCLGTDPDNRCGNGPSELFCMQPCVREKYSVDLMTLEDAKDACAEECMAPTCFTLGYDTLEVMDCIDTECPTECWGE